MFTKDCKEATEVIVSENPETESDEEESYKFKEDQLPYDTILHGSRRHVCHIGFIL